MDPSQIYLETILAARHNLISVGQDTIAEIEKAYAELLLGISNRYYLGELTHDRAASLAASIEEELKKYGSASMKALSKGALDGASFGAKAHKYAIAKTLASVGVAVDFGDTFDAVPGAALEALATRRVFNGGYAKLLATIQKRGLTKAADSIDTYLVEAVGQGLSAGDATKGLAHLMRESLPVESKGIAKLLGPKGGFKKGLTPDVLKYLKSAKAGEAVKGARSLMSDARRIAVSEINAAHHEADAIASARSPLIDNVRWQVSGRHPNLPSTPDRCDILAAEDYYGLGKGVFPSTAIPPLPHPYCLCKTFPIIKPIAEWGLESTTAVEPKSPVQADVEELFKQRTTKYSLPSAAKMSRVLKEREASFNTIQNSFKYKLPEAEPLKLEKLDFSDLEKAFENAVPPVAIPPPSKPFGDFTYDEKKAVIEKAIGAPIADDAVEGSWNVMTKDPDFLKLFDDVIANESKLTKTFEGSFEQKKDIIEKIVGSTIDDDDIESYWKFLSKNPGFRENLSLYGYGGKQPSAAVAAKAAKTIKDIPSSPKTVVANATVSSPAESLAEKFAVAPADLDVIPELKDLVYEKGLGGSTGAKLYRHPETGKRYVVKAGASPDHIREESIADNLYDSVGVRVPRHKLFETPDGPVKIAEFIEGDSLKKFIAKSNSRQIMLVRRDARRNFVYDALFGNWDVAGLDLDNIIVSTKHGATPKLFRIDNGGSFRFRAQGTRKTAAEWSEVVNELDSLRGLHPTIKPNAGASFLYEGVSDKKMLEGIQRVLKKRKQILAATPEELRPIIAKRLDYIARYAEEKLSTVKAIEKTADVVDAVEDAEDAFSGKFADKVYESRSTGFSTLTDEGDIEDNQVLGWWRRNLEGDSETLVQFKLRDNAAVKLKRELDATPGIVRNLSKTTTAPNPTVTSASIFEETKKGYFDAIKSINHHIGEGSTGYNAEKLKKLEDVKNKILELYKDSVIEIPTEWLQLYDKIYDSMATAKPLPFMGEADWPKITMKEVVKAVKPKVSARTVNFQNGWKLVRTETDIDGVDKVVGDQVLDASRKAEEYTITTPEYQIRFSPAMKTSYAFDGLVEIRVAGKPTAATIDKIRKAMADIGQVTTAPDVEYQDALYVFRTMFFRRDLFPDSKRRNALLILEDTAMSSKDKRAELITFYNRTIDSVDESYKMMGKKMPVAYRDAKLPGDKELRRLAKGKTTGKNEAGYRYWERFDIKDKDLEKFGTTHELAHGSNMTTRDFVESITKRNGQVTSTLDRARVGQLIKEGASPDEDLRNGPGAYFYTGITTIDNARTPYGPKRLIFHPKQLNRLDSISASGDFLASQYRITDRVRESMARRVPDYKGHVANRRNETLFKGGFNLYDVHEFICYGYQERVDVIKLLTDWNGSDIWPDGRNIADIVVTRS
jgi:hypothetical protein